VRRAVGFILATSLTALPPLAVIGWFNPLSGAGVAFPGCGWAGLALTTALLACLAAHEFRSSAALACLAALAIARAGTDPAPPVGWLGFDTHFSRMSSAGHDDAGQLLASRRRMEWLRGVAAEMPEGAVLVLPETVLGRYDGAAAGFLRPVEETLLARRAVVLAGAEIPEASRYINSVLALGQPEGAARVAAQSIPVPISMWTPWKDTGARGELWGRPAVLDVNGVRVGFAICYEQLLTFAVLKLMAASPDVVASVSNVWWARETNIPVVQEQSIRAYARLFRRPVLLARNY
jgi:apolipoprotein N-acyltransferase